MLSLDPAAVVLLIGTNDLDEGATPETIASNLKLILAAMKQHAPRTPVVLCLVMPSSATMKRPATAIQATNALFLAAVKGDPQVTVLESYKLFADASGDAPIEEFPDLLHLNEAGYARWAAALRPILATLGLFDTAPDPFTPEPGFESLFNGRDLTGWGYRPTSEADRAGRARWLASDSSVAWPLVDAPVAFDGQASTPDGRFAVVAGRLVVTTPPEYRKIQQLHTTREFPRRLRAAPRVPGHSERRQRRVRARASAAVPRLSAGGSVQGPEGVQAAGLERARGGRPQRRRPRHLQRRAARGRDEAPRNRPHRRRGRPRTDGVPADSDQGRSSPEHTSDRQVQRTTWHLLPGGPCSTAWEGHKPWHH